MRKEGGIPRTQASSVFGNETRIQILREPAVTDELLPFMVPRDQVVVRQRGQYMYHREMAAGLLGGETAEG